MMDHQEQLRKQIENQVKRMKKAERERPNLLSQTVYIGTLGLLIVLPVIGGAYLGHWLDNLQSGYSIRWSLSLIFIGLVVGGINVYLFIREE